MCLQKTGRLQLQSTEVSDSECLQLSVSQPYFKGECVHTLEHEKRCRLLFFAYK